MEETYTIEEIKERICYQMDEVYLIEVLGLDIHDLVNILEDHIIENYNKVLNALDD